MWRSDGKSGAGEVLTSVSELTSPCGEVPFPTKSSLSDGPGPTSSLFAATSRASWLPVRIHSGGVGGGVEMAGR